jgi:hypothetical protein
MERKPTVSPEALAPDSLGETPPLFLPNGVPPLEEGPDPFDPESLRLPQDFSVALGVKKALLTIPVRRPAREWFVRVHPDAAYHLQTAVIELKEVGEVYLVHQDLWGDLAGESTFTSKMLFLTVNRQQVVFFWPVRLPGADGRVDTWSKSALEAAQLAMHTWVRVTPDQSLGGYNVYYAEHVVDPVWPELPMRELLRIAFKDRYIATLDHPILRQLRGEV